MSDRPEAIRRRFADFVAAYPEMPLYRAICSAAVDDTEIAELLLAAQPGQERPVLLLAAIHDLVLQEPRSQTQRRAGRWFASVVGRDRLPAAEEWTDPGPWPDVRALIVEHRAALEATIAGRSMQTNEVNRSTYLLTLLAVVGGPEPIALIEFGTSAGLLLTADQYDVTITPEAGRPGNGMPGEGTSHGWARDAAPPAPDAPGEAAPLRWGRQSSAVRPTGVDRSEPPLADRAPVLPEIVARVGVDLATIAPDDEDALRWLQACLWPDVPDRVERFVAAVAQRRSLVASERPLLIDGDLTDPDDVTRALAAAVAASGDRRPQLVVFTSWTVTYVERSRRAGFAETLADFARSTGLRVSWCSAEPSGGVPGLPALDGPANNEGSTQLGIRSWRDGEELGPVTLGTADPHGRWLHLR